MSYLITFLLMVAAGVATYILVETINNMETQIT